MSSYRFMSNLISLTFIKMTGYSCRPVSSIRLNLKQEQLNFTINCYTCSWSLISTWSSIFAILDRYISLSSFRSSLLCRCSFLSMSKSVAIEECDPIYVRCVPLMFSSCFSKVLRNSWTV
jgi:hypothetical protein